MAPILRVKARWSGLTGGTGYSVFHLRDFGGSGNDGVGAGSTESGPAAQKIYTLFNAIRSFLPDECRIDIEPDVEQIEETNGQLLNVYGVGGLPTIEGSSTGVYAAASGGVINWTTGGIRNGRRVRGRTFLVPLASNAYGPNGLMATPARDAIFAAANNAILRSDVPDLGVYARPTSPTANDGAWFVADAASVPSNLAILTSRRD